MYRIALGYDLHRLKKTEGNLICGGVSIPCSYVIEGAHSDGDVIYHALTDALLSVCGTDIGQVFPNTSKENHNRNSIEFVECARDMIVDKYKIINIDIVVICDCPKISPHIEMIKSNISMILGISDDDISIRGKTTENTSSLTISSYCNVLFQKQ